MKSSNRSKNSNLVLITNRGSKLSLTKSGSCHNMNPPPIGGYINNRDTFISPSNNSLTSINNINIRNSNSNNKKSIKYISSINNNTFVNNTTLTTNKPKHSSLKKGD